MKVCTETVQLTGSSLLRKSPALSVGATLVVARSGQAQGLPLQGEGEGEGEAFHAHERAAGAWGIASAQRERGNPTALAVRDCFGRYAPSQ